MAVSRRPHAQVGPALAGKRVPMEAVQLWWVWGWPSRPRSTSERIAVRWSPRPACHPNIAFHVLERDRSGPEEGGHSHPGSTRGLWAGEGVPKCPPSRAICVGLQGPGRGLCRWQGPGICCGPGSHSHVSLNASIICSHSFGTHSPSGAPGQTQGKLVQAFDLLAGAAAV